MSSLTWQRLHEVAEQTGRTLSQVLDDLITLAASHPGVSPLLEVRGLAVSEAEATSLASLGEDWPVEPSPPLVLVLEDDTHSLDLLTLRLEHLGCRVSGMDDVERAFQIARHEKPALIIADLELHGDKNAGIAFIRRLRAQAETAHIPIVVHSVYVRHVNELPRPLPSVEAMLPKPFMLADLVALVTPLLPRDPDNTQVRIL